VICQVVIRKIQDETSWAHLKKVSRRKKKLDFWGIAYYYLGVDKKMGHPLRQR
jgi:hypothetical protein